MDRKNIVLINALTFALWFSVILHGFLWVNPVLFLCGQLTLLALSILLYSAFRPLLTVYRKFTGIHTHLPFLLLIFVTAMYPPLFISGWIIGLRLEFVQEAEHTVRKAMTIVWLMIGVMTTLTVLRLVYVRGRADNQPLNQILCLLTLVSLVVGPGFVVLDIFGGAYGIEWPFENFHALPYTATVFFGVCFLYAQASLRNP
ncbi:MAG: hypothetical protein NUW37_18685 [Planctomycetes bacterium]|nr:hypothetical protein [Planctomycetota bacterium]